MLVKVVFDGTPLFLLMAKQFCDKLGQNGLRLEIC